jgi:hypothetical protein
MVVALLLAVYEVPRYALVECGYGYGYGWGLFYIQGFAYKVQGVKKA